MRLGCKEDASDGRSRKISSGGPRRLCEGMGIFCLFARRGVHLSLTPGEGALLTRRTLLELPALSLFSFYLPAAWSFPDLTRRALVVGIDRYVVSRTFAGDEPTSSGGHASTSESIKRNQRLFDLDGAVNDAMLMAQLLKDRFGFLPENVVLLKNEQATRVRILHEFQMHLIDAASPGDISLFYYAGHGSQVQNLASDEADQLDETLVPADSSAGAADIRDKELARLYRAALNKRILLTVILDSCHSGGMSRGGWNGTGKTRNLRPDPRTVNDPPDLDRITGKKLPDPASMGMLFLAAAREDQPAGETTVTEREGSGVSKEISYGAFTAALARVLQSSMANQSVEQICDRVQALLASEGSMQVPICAGVNRESRGLLGQPAGLANSITLSVEAVRPGGTIRLRGGSAVGLGPGCLLVRSGGQPVRIQLTRVELGMSEAKLVGGIPASSVHAGDLFKLETWVAPPRAALEVFFAKDGPSADSVLAVARSISQLSERKIVQLLSDIEPGNPPTHVVYWRNATYLLERYPFDGKSIHLGLSPSVEDMAKALGTTANVRLWPILPPDDRIAADLRLGAGTDNGAIQVGNDPTSCVYLLTGRLNRDAVEYSWISKDAFMANPNRTGLPLQTDWTASAEQLTSLAMRLARIYAWLNLSGPTGGDDAFPYHLVFERPGKREPAGTGPFKFGERYKFAFQASLESLRQASNSGGVSKRYVYVFLIDSAGDAKCCFPIPANGNDGNRLPREYPPSPWIEATRQDYDVEISEPAGMDYYFLVASEEPLDPEIFQWTGVRGHELQRGSGTPLEFLFSSVGGGTRGTTASHAVPATWSIQSIAVRSVP